MMNIADIAEGCSYIRADNTVRYVKRIVQDSRYLGGRCVEFIASGGPRKNLKPGSGFASIDVFAELSEREVPNETTTTNG